MNPEEKAVLFRFVRDLGARGYAEERKQGAPWLNIALFVATLVSTTYVGALHNGVNLVHDFSRFAAGLPFALTLMSILVVHELGHYALAKIHGVDATLPYFIPAPSFVGTFGAVIRMRSSLRNRSQLLDIGAAGPLAGFVVAVIAAYVGLKLSVIGPVVGEAGGMELGSSLAFSFLSFLALGNLPADINIALHPVALAGWIGLLITGMNLLPAGQLDGGHVAYALLGRNHWWVSLGVVFILLCMGLFAWEGWLFWGFLLSVLGASHPSPTDSDTPLNQERKVLVWMTLAVFILTFVPVPFTFVDASHFGVNG